jgi:hypothetical protein
VKAAHHAQAFGFGHGAAHAVFKGYAGPGPAAYVPHEVAHHLPGGRTIFGSGHVGPTITNTPGVGSYNPNVSHHVTVAHMGSGHVGPTITATPGVGHYSPQLVHSHSQAYGFGHGVARPVFTGTGVPGAGKYDVNVDAHDRHTYITDDKDPHV